MAASQNEITKLLIFLLIFLIHRYFSSNGILLKIFIIATKLIKAVNIYNLFTSLLFS